jgi:hypothetical protein
MATTSKELIEILQKYTDPDEIVIWQYYTRNDFAEELTRDEFEEVADTVENWELWTNVHDGIKEAIWEVQKKAVN